MTAPTPAARAKRRFLWLFAALVLWRLVPAAALDLFGDEAFYRMCARRPDLGYADLPPLTALLVRAGITLLGDTPLGVRSLFLLLGAALPWLVYLAARPHVRPDRAWQAACWALLVPGLAWEGLVALPDVPLMAASLGCLCCIDRACRGGDPRWWAAAGLVCAAGFTVHYRFVLAPLACLLFLVFTRAGRAHLRTPGPWLCGIIAAVGLGPMLAYNLGHDFSPLRYFLGVRQSGAFHAGAYGKFVLKQAGLVTPLVFGLLVPVAVRLWRRARAGEPAAALYGAFAGVPLLLYFAAAPFQHTGVKTMHWPLAGYPALLVYLPDLLADLRMRTGALRGVALAAPWTAAAGTACLLLGLVLPWPVTAALRAPFQGSRELAAETRTYLAEMADVRPLLVADHYKSGAALEFALGDAVPLYVMAHSKNFEHGRQLQFDLWDMGEAALKRAEPTPVLLVVELSEIPRDYDLVWWRHLDTFFKDKQLLGEWTYRVPGARGVGRQFAFYRARLDYGP